MGKRGPRHCWKGEPSGVASNEEVAGDPISPLRICFLFLLVLWASTKDGLMGKSAFLKRCIKFQSRRTCIFFSELEWSLMLPLHPLSPGCGRHWVPFSGGFLPSHPLLWEGCLHTQHSHGSLLWSAGLNHLTLAAAHWIAVLCHQSTWVKLCTLGAWSWYCLGRGGTEQPPSHCPGKLNFGYYFLPCRSKNLFCVWGVSRECSLFLCNGKMYSWILLGFLENLPFAI